MGHLYKSLLKPHRTKRKYSIVDSIYANNLLTIFFK